MTRLLTYLRRLFTSSWVVADPDPQPSWLDRKDGAR